MPKEKLVFVNDLAPGDILIMSVAIRSLHKAYPDRFWTDVRSPANEIFNNNPYVQKIPVPDPVAANKAIEDLKKDENHPPIMVGDTKYVISHYPEIHRSGMTGLPFVDGHRMFLERQLQLSIPRTGMKPDIFFSPQELSLPRQVEGKYWIINAGIKNDYTLKWYPYYQQVVDLLKGKVQFVQIGHSAHNHPPLKGVIDMRGKTSLRQLFLLSHYAEGAICAVSLQMVIQAALGKPCVVVAGAREGTRWQLNPDHRFLYLTGAMKCAKYDGCWKSKLEQCVFKSKQGNPMCMELIRPEDIARAVELYYLGGRLEYDNIEPVILNKGEKTMPPIKATELNGSKPEVSKATPIIEDSTPKILNETKGIATSGKIITDDMKSPQINAAVFNTLRILKKLSPSDTYLEAYQGHFAKRKETFMDHYHFAWWIGAVVKPRRILEIGTRTGISMCQLLSAYVDHSVIERIVCCDLFQDGLATPQLVIKNLQHLNIPVLDRLEFIVGNSSIELPALIQKEIDYKFDYILVDGNHERDASRSDLENAVKLIQKGGFIVYDDLTEDGCNLQPVWDDFKLAHKEEFLFDEDYNGKGTGVARRL